MLYKSAFILLATLVTSSIASVEAPEEKQKISPGLYRIVNPSSGAWARNLPGPGHQGPWRSSISMTTHFSSIYQTWEVTPYEEGFSIRNYGSGNWAFSSGITGDPVQGFSDGLTKWYIEPAGGNEYRIHYPNKDLIWTVQDDDFGQTLSLKHADGTDDQLFKFMEF